MWFICSRSIRCEIFGHGINDMVSRNPIQCGSKKRRGFIVYCYIIIYTRIYNVGMCIYKLDNVFSVWILRERFNLIAYIMGRIATTYVARWRNIRLQMFTEQKMLLNLYTCIEW